jgi:hypothetical protein
MADLRNNNTMYQDPNAIPEIGETVVIGRDLMPGGRPNSPTPGYVPFQNQKGSNKWDEGGSKFNKKMQQVVSPGGSNRPEDLLYFALQKAGAEKYTAESIVKNLQKRGNVSSLGKRFMGMEMPRPGSQHQPYQREPSLDVKAIDRWANQTMDTYRVAKQGVTKGYSSRDAYDIIRNPNRSDRVNKELEGIQSRYANELYQPLQAAFDSKNPMRIRAALHMAEKQGLGNSNQILQTEQMLRNMNKPADTTQAEASLMSKIDQRLAKVNAYVEGDPRYKVLANIDYYPVPFESNDEDYAAGYYLKPPEGGKPELISKDQFDNLMSQKTKAVNHYMANDPWFQNIFRQHPGLRAYYVENQFSLRPSNPVTGRNSQRPAVNE